MLWENLKRGLLRISGGREMSALVDQAIVSGANFITNVILARSLGPRDFGVFALAWMAVLFANSLQFAFVITPMMSVGPKQEPADRPLYYAAVLVQEIIFALICSLAVLLAVRLSAQHFPRWDVHGLGIPLSIATLAYLLQDFVRRYLFSTRRSKLALASDAVSYLTQLPIILWMAPRAHFTSQAALWVIALTSLAGFVVGCYWFEPIRLQFRALRAIFLRHWKISRWLAPSAFMQWSSGNLFVMAAPFYYGAAAAGILRASQNIVGVAHIWFLGLDNVVPAEAARRMHSKGLDASFDYIKQILWRWGLITLFFLALVALFPSLWLKIYGAKYEAYGYILRLYALFYFVVFFAGPLRAGLQALEYTAPLFWSYLAMTGFSILFAGPFAKHLGLTGVMLGMTAAQILFQTIVGAGLVLRVRRMRRDFLLTPPVEV
ncbi:MAG: lipopolysaccharide biosynthesis protein [Silvibacterium sp.]|nr:lipopolysaccharide biosynthesis protein [Silvibacterium sp.]